MKRIKILLCLLGSLLLLSVSGQQNTEETSWEKLSLFFESIDQLGYIPEYSQGSNFEDIQWTQLLRVSHQECELKIEYNPDKKQDKSSVCSLAVQQANPEDFELISIAGIPCIKLELSNQSIFVMDDAQEVSRKTTTLFFRACYEKAKFEELKSAFKKVKKDCL